MRQLLGEVRSLTVTELATPIDKGGRGIGNGLDHVQSAIEFCMTAALSLMSRRVTRTIFLKIDSKLKVCKQTWILGTVSVESKDIRQSSGLYLDLLCSDCC